MLRRRPIARTDRCGDGGLFGDDAVLYCEKTLNIYQDRLGTDVCRVDVQKKRRFWQAVELRDLDIKHPDAVAVGKTASFLSFPYVCPEPVLVK